MTDYIDRQAAIEALAGWKISPIVLDPVPSADVRENVKSEKVISGGSADSDGATLWFRCSACDGSVDISDNFCKHCGADMRGEA